MIKIDSLYKNYINDNGTTEALRNINLDIQKGDIFGIIGLSGAGKSTLIRCINRLEEPTSGRIYIDEEEITAMNERKLLMLRRRIGMIFQSFNLLNRRSCSRNIGFPLEVAGWNKREITNRVDQLLELVGLQDKKDSYPNQLSGGQKQRIAIARALSTKADILLCDEATSALDPSTTKSILGLLKDINTKLGVTIIMITHQMEVIKEICNRVAVISDGIIVEQGSSFEVFSKPKHEATKKLLDDLGSDNQTYGCANSKGARRLEISFLENDAHKPIISELIKTTNADINIIEGHISRVQGRPYGRLIVDITGSEIELCEAINYLKKRNLYYEELR